MFIIDNDNDRLKVGKVESRWDTYHDIKAATGTHDQLANLALLSFGKYSRSTCPVLKLPTRHITRPCGAGAQTSHATHDQEHRRPVIAIHEEWERCQRAGEKLSTSCVSQRDVEASGLHAEAVCNSSSLPGHIVAGKAKTKVTFCINQWRGVQVTQEEKYITVLTSTKPIYA